MLSTSSSPFFVSRALMFLAALHRAQRAAGFAGASQLWPLPGVDMGTLELGRELGLPLGANSFFLWLRVQEMFFLSPLLPICSLLSVFWALREKVAD